MGDTLVNLRTLLRTKVGNPSTAQVADTVLTSVINRSIKNIADRYRFHATRKVATFPTVVGVDKYTLPTDLNVMMKVAIQTTATVQGRRLRKVSFGFINSNNQLTNAMPTRYAIVQGYLQLWWPPDAIYTVQMQYRFNPVALSADNDPCTFPPAWDDGVVLGARYIYWDDNGDVSKALYSLNTYNKWLEDKTDEIGAEYFTDWDQGVSVPTLQESSDESDIGRYNDFDKDD